MKKTLGGDRLGSGKKMTVDMRTYNRSTHDIGYVWRSTMAAGTLVPFLSIPILPGDTFDISLDVDIKTHPTIGPLFGSFKIQLDIFEAPLRLYQAHLHNNQLNIGLNMSQIKLPVWSLDLPTFDPLAPVVTNFDNTQINPSCILAYLGVRGVGHPGTASDAQRHFNGVPLLAYWDIYKNYYANKQEEIGAVLHTDTPALVETVDAITNTDGQNVALFPTVSNVTMTNTLNITFTGATPLPEQIMLNTTIGRYSIDYLTSGIYFIASPGSLIAVYDRGKFGDIQIENWQYIQNNEINQKPPVVTTFPLTNIDDMRNEILAFATTFNQFNINALDLEPYNLVLNRNADEYNFALNNQEGLALKTYQSDLFNNWLETEWIDGPNGISEITSIDTSGGSFTIDTLNLSKKVYDMLNRIAVSGGSYNDWIDTVYQENRFTRAETPIYHGGLIKELIFQEVVSNSASESTDGNGQPLGTLAGKGVMAKKHKGGGATIKASEPGYIIGIISLTPRIDYSQGNAWDTHLETMDDFHKPALDEIGFQELITEQMAWWDTQYNDLTNLWETKSAGKQPAWINYMTNVNKTYGNFAIEDNEMFMTLNRRYEYAPAAIGVSSIKDLTTYIDPAKFNNIFAQTDRTAQNFWAQIGVDITARRLMSAKIMPNL